MHRHPVASHHTRIRALSSDHPSAESGAPNKAVPLSAYKCRRSAARMTCTSSVSPPAIWWRLRSDNE
eukprot:756667-Hanusia_phi.AAC.2